MRSLFLRAVFVSVGLMTTIGCRTKADTANADASAQPFVAPTPPPVPPEPIPPSAAKAADVPALEAKLLADPGYRAAWDGAHVIERGVFLTALSEFVVHGTSDTETAGNIKRMKLGEAENLVRNILWRVGRLPADLKSRVESYLSTNATAARHGVWTPDQKGQPPFDATGLAMWLHPNDPNYVRERVLALAKGPLPWRKDAPVVRSWLGNLGEIVERLNALGAFTKDDCLGLGAAWSEKIAADGGTYFACEPAKSVAPSQAPATPTIASSSDQDALRKACGVGPGTNLQVADEVEIKVMCRMKVEKMLKSPKSAEHPGAFDQDERPRSLDGCTTIYPSYVDAQNSFGAQLRQRYLCTYDPRTGLADVVFTKD